MRNVNVWVVCALAVSTGAFAQGAAGVSDERVVLPAAPGSIDGVGENATVEGNQGAMRYNIKVEIPKGFEGLTPQVDLTYSSSGGASVVGMGWSFPTYAIERMTSKGLQKYDLTDRFALGGSDEFSKVSESGATAVYRARFEGTFVRYTWRNRGTGEGGYWTAEYPDGRIGYYGADATGADVTAAQVRVPTTAKVWRWNLVLVRDPFGHEMKLTWTKDSSGHPLLERMDYVFEGSLPRHSVRFTYEGRTDIISNATPGFELKLTQRLKDIRVFSGTTNPELVRSYTLDYEPEMMAGGATRLRRVQRFGKGNLMYPVSFNFGYSKTLGGVCDMGCEKPFVASMGTLSGVDFSTGRATLIDMTGDALPDVVFSNANGVHQIFTAKLDGEGRTSFNMTPRTSAMTTGSSPFTIGEPRVQVIDVNGDGFTDITNAKVPAVLCNNGSGDWVDAGFCTGSSVPGLPSNFEPEDDSGDQGQADPRFVRFFDYNNDRRIDWLRTLAGGTDTQVIENTTSGFNTVTVQNIGLVFDDTPGFQLADMNGDGLQDPVRISASGMAVQVEYRLNLGWGTWTDWRSITLSGLDASQATSAELQDINGDGLADVVVVSGNEVSLALNRNGDRFDAVMTIRDANLTTGSMIPTRTPTTTVMYADMNGNGSDDIVWVQSNGDVRYLELFPVRPNLIARIDNGIGNVQLVTYGTSVVEQARDGLAGMPWLNRVPNPYSMVKRLDSFVTLTGSDTGGLKEITTYRYHSGFYDGVEKQFRGYETVEREMLSDMSRDAQEPGLMIDDYDVGKTEPAFAGVKLRSRAHAGMGASLALIHDETTLTELCMVAEVTGAVPPVKFPCTRGVTTTFIERGTAANAFTTRSEFEYDGYGNMKTERHLGVIHKGPVSAPTGCDACTTSGEYGRPCGMMCTGDEQFTEREFIAPGASTGNAWIANRARRIVAGAVLGMTASETQLFYDGPDFEGLPAGQLTKGATTRSLKRFGPGANDFIPVTRLKRDSHGNAVEAITALGSPTAAVGKRVWTYEQSGLNALSYEIRLSEAAGQVQAIRRDYVFGADFGLLTQNSNYYAVVNGMPASTPLQTSYRYDAHGRLQKIIDPGDTDANPSQEFVFELGDPSSRILIQERSAAGLAAPDLVEARCLDGRGRLFQTRERLADNRWQVSGFTEFDARGAPVRKYQPYVAASGACETMPPSGVPFTRFTYDPLGRLLTETEPDMSVRRNEYGPLWVKRYDENDTDMSSPHANTPTVEEYDGLDRLVGLNRTLTSGGEAVSMKFGYDALSNVAFVRDARGNLKTQVYDAADRLVRVNDTNSGATTYEYDNAGNQTKRTDARMKVVRTQYDAANRPVAQWDEADEAGTKLTWKYDRLDGCAQCTNGAGEVVELRWASAAGGGADRFGYDPKGNPVYKERSIGGKSFITRRSYDGAERETQVQYPGGITFTSKYDGASRLTEVTGYVDRVDYDERGQVKTIAFSNGAKTDYTYDNRLRLATLKTVAKDGSGVLDLGYTRNRVGDITALADGSRAGRPRHGFRATYDALDRVTGLTLDRDPEAETLSFSFDAIDNITSISSSLGGASKAHVGMLAYDAMRPNAATQAGDVASTYDAAGSLSSRAGVSFTRDYLGRMVQASRDGAVVAKWEYANAAEKIVQEQGDSSTWYVDDGFELKDGIANAYVSVGDLRVARVQSAATARLVLPDQNSDMTVDIADAWLTQKGGGAAGSVLASAARRLLVSEKTWLHADHLKSVVAATGSDGALVAEQAFYPFGEVRGSTGFVDTYGFTGQERVAATDLVHFDFRELDPRSGRWGSVDPAFHELESTSLRFPGEALGGYAYVANNFANSIDPSGLTRQRSGAVTAKTKTASGQTHKQAAKQAAKKGEGKKGLSKAEKIGRALQILTSVIGAVMAIAAAAETQEAAEEARAGDANAPTHSVDAAKLGTVAASISGTSALIGAGLDIKANFGKDTDTKKASKKGGDNGGDKSTGTKGSTSTEGKQGPKEKKGQPKPNTASKIAAPVAPKPLPTPASSPQPTTAPSTGASQPSSSSPASGGPVK